MSPELLIGIASFGFTVFCAIAGMIYRIGQHSQRLTQSETDIKELNGKADKAAEMSTSLQVFANAMGTMKDQISEIRHDVKNILTGRVVTTRRKVGDE